MDTHFWLLFFSAVIAFNLSPGPDLIFILTKTISAGRKVGIAASLGVCVGALFHVVIAAVGLSAIIVSSALAFTVIKTIGAVYLLYLAYQAFRSSGTPLAVDAEANFTGSASTAFKQGIMIDVLNPKVAIFFMAFLPQFVREGAGSTSWQLFYLGLLVILVAVVVELIYVLLIARFTEKLRNNRSFGLWLDRTVGVIFVALGLKLVISSNA